MRLEDDDDDDDDDESKSLVIIYIGIINDGAIEIKMMKITNTSNINTDDL